MHSFWLCFTVTLEIQDSRPSICKTLEVPADDVGQLGT